MDFGALSNPALMDQPGLQAKLRLKADSPYTSAKLSRNAGTPTTSKPAKLRVGLPVWANPKWVGKIYPRKMPAAQALFHYSRQFSVIELNSSFYRMPDDATIARWKSEVPEGFLFCPKIPREISHDRLLQGTSELTREFVRRMRALGPSLGPCWILLPPGFGPDAFGSLASWLAEWPRDLALAIEFRHPGWFTQDGPHKGGLHPEAARLLEAHGVAAVITDAPARRDVLHMTLTANWTLIRYAGNQRHPFDQIRLQDWADRLKLWFAGGLKGALFFVHEPDETDIPETSNDFASRVNETCRDLGVEVEPWTPPEVELPAQARLPL